MADPTEALRREAVHQINSEVESNDADTERSRLEAKHGQVWDTQELGKDFVVHGFMAPFITVTRQSDSQKGIMEFQHMPRFYFNFKES